MPARRDRLQIVGSFLTLIAVAIIITVWNDHRIDQAEKRIIRNTNLAISANVKAARAEEFVKNFRERLSSEKVCSESNRGDACRALFQRLAEDLSPQQRRDLACAVADELKLPQYREFCDRA